MNQIESINQHSSDSLSFLGPSQTSSLPFRCLFQHFASLLSILCRRTTFI